MEENSAGTIAKFEHDTLEINHIIRQELRARERTQKPRRYWSNKSATRRGIDRQK